MDGQIFYFDLKKSEYFPLQAMTKNGLNSKEM